MLLALLGCYFKSRSIPLWLSHNATYLEVITESLNLTASIMTTMKGARITNRDANRPILTHAAVSLIHILLAKANENTPTAISDAHDRFEYVPTFREYDIVSPIDH